MASRETPQQKKLLETVAENMQSRTSIVNTVDAMKMAVEDFAEHVDNCNITFKQCVVSKAKSLKKTDETTLTERVEEMKGQEGSELSRLNTILKEKQGMVRGMEVQRDRNEQIIMAWIDQWRHTTKVKKLFRSWKEDTQEIKKEKRSAQFCQNFYERGLLQRSLRRIKLFAQVCGNKMHERRMREVVTIKVHAEVEENIAQQEFLEALIKELEEKHRIELRKKAILKNQCDQAYLRGVAAISNEALKMSHSTLNDYYQGQKQQRYDGANVLSQLKALQGSAMASQLQTQSVTVTQSVQQRPPVPPLRANFGVRSGSFDSHVRMSKGDQATSKMFNEQSFGR